MKCPNAIEAEKKLISALMLGTPSSAEAIAQVSEVLKPEEFYRIEHSLIYSAIQRACKDDVAPDIVQIEDELNKTGDIKRVRRDYLFALLDYEFTATRAMQYVAQIKETAQRRQLERIGDELMSEATDEMLSVDDVLAKADSLLQKVTTEQAEPSLDLFNLMTQTWETVEARRKNGGQLLGVSTGFIALDRLTCGLKKSDLIILAARPSMGKTALALNMALNAARKVPVAFFSLEMSASQLGERILSYASGVEATKISTGNYSQEEGDDIMMGICDLENRKVQIDDRSQTLNELRRRARQMKRNHNVGLIVIDYIQLIVGDKAYKGNRVQEVSDISRQLKAMAKELDVPILALSQLNRGAEVRADKRPRLSDLRESGSIEQDADIVMFIYRDAYYNADSQAQNIAEVRVAKNRNGATGQCNLYFDGSKCRFRDLIREVS